MKKLGLLLVVLLCVFNVQAKEGKSSTVTLDSKNLYVGGGLGLNSLSGIEFDDGIGFQMFAGYVLPTKLTEADLSIEIGYMDSGNVDVGRGSGDVKAKGLWSTAVITVPLKGRVSVLGRAGLDFGDDDGFMFGAGFEFKLKDKVDLRTEYVVRDNIDSLQVNLIVWM